MQSGQFLKCEFVLECSLPFQWFSIFPVVPFLSLILLVSLSLITIALVLQSVVHDSSIFIQELVKNASVELHLDWQMRNSSRA